MMSRMEEGMLRRLSSLGETSAEQIRDISAHEKVKRDKLEAREAA